MTRTESIPSLMFPNLGQALTFYTVDEVKWYATPLAGGKLPTRKPELVDLVTRVLLEPRDLRRLWEQLTPQQQLLVADTVHTLGGRYDSEVLSAKYPGVAAPLSPRQQYGYSYFSSAGVHKKEVTAFDLFFYHNYDTGYFIPRDLAECLRSFAPTPPEFQLESYAAPPPTPMPAWLKLDDEPLKVFQHNAEPAIMHDLLVTLYLIQEGKLSVSAATRMPTLSSVRQIRARLLNGDYAADGEYSRAEEAIGPLALALLVQAGKWAVPAGGKLELTKRGQALLSTPLQANHIRELWERWLKSDLLDELSRISGIKGQQAKETRLTKPPDRRAQLDAALRHCPAGRWVSLDDFFRFLRAHKCYPMVERPNSSGLYLGSSFEYGLLTYGASGYWDVVIGSYLRALLWEYAATLGLIEIRYTRPEETPYDVAGAYHFDDQVSRYDGLLSFRLTDLGAYVFGLTQQYSAATPDLKPTTAILQALPNLDLVIIDAKQAQPGDRGFLERIAEQQSQDVYRLSKQQVLEAIQHGLTLKRIKEFLVAKSGLAERDLPQTVRVFFEDVERRVGALREGGTAVIFEGDDPILLTELANHSTLRALVRLTTINERIVLLVPAEHEAAARRQLKKLGYIPRKA